MTQLLHTAREFDAEVAARPGEVAVVMTMGALHEGHGELIRAARAGAGTGCVVVTVFVNPLQFGPGEDFDRYPRTLDADLAFAAEAGADIVFAPAVSEVYPDGAPLVRIAAGPMGERYEGASRPGHFDGMLTVVAKLLHLTHADLAFYGQKDDQQLALIRRMVADLDLGVRIVAVPTVREPDGLALLQPQPLPDRRRTGAPPSRCPARCSRAGTAVRRGPAAVLEVARAVLDEADVVRVDYLVLIDPPTSPGPPRDTPARRSSRSPRRSARPG